jgi:hypothetical protein
MMFQNLFVDCNDLLKAIRLTEKFKCKSNKNSREKRCRFQCAMLAIEVR